MSFDATAILERLALTDSVPRAPTAIVGPQPSHVVYGGAHLFRADTVSKLGEIARKSQKANLATPTAMARVFSLPIELTEGAFPGIVAKLELAPVEDYRIDFEDGYGLRADADEDAHARAAGAELAKAVAAGVVAPRMGVRIKALAKATRARSLRTFGLFFEALLSKGSAPDHFVVTLPKVTHPAEVGALDEALDAIDPARRIGIELMVETPEALFDANAKVALPAMIDAGNGRVTGAHFGTYDFTASLGVVAAYQTPTHPACDFALGVMQVACASRLVEVSDGATTELPIAPHRGADLDTTKQWENSVAIERALHHHYENVRRTLARGIYQGWDLHPAQIPARLVATHAFFLEALESATERLIAFRENQARATLLGTSFDDAATGRGLTRFFERAIAAKVIEAAP